MYDYAINLLLKMAKAKSVPHTLLFSGYNGAAKKHTAVAFVRFLLQESEEGYSPVLREAAPGPVSGDSPRFGKENTKEDDEFSHPDFYSLDASGLGIKKVREVRTRFALAPFSARSKVALIDNAEELSKESSNALLKTIEEPRGDAFFIFLAKSRKFLLPTIASRAFEVRFVGSPETNDSAIKDAEDFENMTFYEKFSKIQEYDLKNKKKLLNFLDSWLVRLRADVLRRAGTVPASKQGQSLLPENLARDILMLKKIISNTNSNPQILMEQLCVKHYL